MLESGGAKSSGPGRENRMNQDAAKGSGQSSSTSQETKTKESTLVARSLQSTDLPSFIIISVDENMASIQYSLFERHFSYYV